LYIDILIFAAIAGFLIFRLMSVLGTRHGGERQRRNPFAPDDKPAAAHLADEKDGGVIIDMPARVMDFAAVVDAGADAPRVQEGLSEIAAADSGFEINSFMQGARYAFDMIVTAYTKGERETLKPLLSPKLYADFLAGIQKREELGHRAEITIHRILKSKIIDARLGGVMAYVTVDFDVEETTVTRDSAGNIVDGNPDRIFSVQDIWTFTRDIRASDPNWVLIETRAP
jgi:predicted lipid-binding transport protein (Tim44 family)